MKKIISLSRIFTMLLFAVFFALPSQAETTATDKKMIKYFKSWCKGSGLPHAKVSSSGDTWATCNFTNRQDIPFAQPGPQGRVEGQLYWGDASIRKDASQARDFREAWKKAKGKVTIGEHKGIEDCGQEALGSVGARVKWTNGNYIVSSSAFRDYWKIEQGCPSAKGSALSMANALNSALGGKVDRILGVAIVPYMPDVVIIPYAPGQAADATEKALYKITGQLEEVDRVYTSKSPTEMFNTLLKIKEDGKLIDFLVISGHGSLETPGVKFHDAPLQVNDVDLFKMRFNLIRQVKNLLNIKDFTKRASSSPQEGVNIWLNHLEYITSISDTMAMGATAFLINCSTAGTPEGQTFLKKLGKVLMAKRGGFIVASQKDVIWGSVEDRWDQWAGLWHSGKLTEPGEIWYGGDWITVPIDADIDPQTALSFALPEDLRYYVTPTEFGNTDHITLNWDNNSIEITNHKKLTVAIEELLRDSQEKYLKPGLGDAGAENIADIAKFKDHPDFIYELIFARGFYLVKLSTTDANEVEQLRSKAKIIDAQLKSIMDVVWYE